MMARAALNNLANATAGRAATRLARRTTAQGPHPTVLAAGNAANRRNGGLHRYDHHHTAHQIACAGDNPG